MKIKKNFDRQLRNLLYVRDIERKDLARELGVSVPTLNRWMCGASIPDVYQLQQIASYFDVSYSWLLDGEESDAAELAKRLNISDGTVKAMLCVADSECQEVMPAVEKAIWSVLSAVMSMYDVVDRAVEKERQRRKEADDA